MSYRFYLFTPRPDAPALDAAHAHFEGSFIGLEPGLPPAGKDRRNQRLAAALTACNPALKVAPLHTPPADRDQASAIQALGLTEPGSASGIEIGLFDAFATLTIPYWHQYTQADAALAEAWAYLKLIEREAGYAAYDPQLDQMLDLASDVPAVAAAYQRAVRSTREIAASWRAGSRTGD